MTFTRRAPRPGARRATFLGVCLFGAGMPLFAVPAHAQRTPSRPAVFLRQVRIDSILLVFGVDSTRVHDAVVNALSDARRLAPAPDSSVPSLDVDVTAMRLAGGGMLEPRGYVRVEVGRNLMESGAARSLVWEGIQQLPPSPTWHEFGRSTLPTVLLVVHDYLLGRSGNQEAR